MHCPSCGHEVVEDQKFCQNCGQSLAGVTEPTGALKITPSPEPPAEFSTAKADDVEPADPAAPTEQIDQTEAPIETSAPTGEVDQTDDAPLALPVVQPLHESDELPQASDLPTREINPRPPIPEPDWATPTGDTPTIASDPAHDATTAFDSMPAPLDSTAPVPDLTSTAQIPVQGGADSTTTMDAIPGTAPGVHTDEFPAVFDGSADIHEYPDVRDPFKLKLVFVFAFFGAIGVLMAAVADIIDIRTSAPVDGIATGIRTLDTLGTNLAVAGFFGATVMALGGLLACFGFRWGAGLAGGAGLALAGWAAMVVALAELRIADAESTTRLTTDVAFTLKVTRDLGFWLTVAVGVIGVLVFIASLRSFGTGGRPALNPWIGALGAVAGVVLVAGPLLPEGNATFANNFQSATTTLDLPTLYFAGRLVQLALIGGAIVFGLLIVRAYGLGLAAGSISVAFWMWLSSLLEMGSFPLGIAAGNFGASSSAPHAVTTVGMALTILMLIVAAVLATVGSQRQRRY